MSLLKKKNYERILLFRNKYGIWVILYSQYMNNDFKTVKKMNLLFKSVLYYVYIILLLFILNIILNI